VNKTPIARFTEFIEYFPLLTPPVSLLPDFRHISSSGIPLPGIMIEAYIFPFEGDEVDEYTEYVPYGRLEGTRDFHALIYWKAGLVQYEFVLATYSPDGKPLSHAIIGGLRSDEDGFLHSVAVINDDMRVTIAEGITADENESLDVSNTNTYQMTIREDGSITYDLNEESKEA